MDKDYTAQEIFEKLKWFHGESFCTENLTRDFLKILEIENHEQ